MGKRIDPSKKVMQRSIGFKFYHMKFFADYPDFKPDKYCREAIDKQIKLINGSYLPEDE